MHRGIKNKNQFLCISTTTTINLNVNILSYSLNALTCTFILRGPHITECFTAFFHSPR